MIVELAGLPGSGKTTLQGPLLEGFQARGSAAILPKQLEEEFSQGKLGQKLLMYGRLWGEVFGECVGSSQLLTPFIPKRCAPYYWVMKDLFLCSSYQRFEEYYREKGFPIYFASEGLVQHIANLRVWQGFDLPLSRRWLTERVCSNMRIILLEIDPKIGFERMWERGVPESWPKSCHEREEAERKYRDFGEALSITVKEFERFGSSIDRVSTSVPLSQSVSLVEAALFGGKDPPKPKQL